MMSLYRKRIQPVLCLMGLLVSMLVSEVTIASAVDDFAQRLKAMNAMSAGFTQTVFDNSGRVLQQIEGTLSVKTPGKMYWQTSPDFGQLVVSDGDTLWVYDQDLEQVTIRDLAKNIQDTPALLLSGNEDDIGQHFSVTKASLPEEVRYRLVPKDNSRLFEALDFSYVGDALVSMTILDAAGQVTVVSFVNSQLNPDLDDALFAFVVPEKTDVIDARGG